MYYLSVYVKSFKELFLYCLEKPYFSKASAKVLTISHSTKSFRKKVCFSAII
ncbi:transcriptional regulator [Prevotella copri]|nr:transcriptional regulator [Segatella copri]MQN18141.1 transcriptional regulator [Segatella copri]